MPAGEKSAPRNLDLEQIEDGLRARLAEVGEQIGELTKPPQGSAGVQFGKRVGDGTTEAISRFTDVGVANDLQAISERIERALAKLAEASYGICDSCSRPIAEGRLRAAPESALCVDCARAQ